MAVTSPARGARLGWPGALAWGLWALFGLGMGLVAWLDVLLRRAGRPELAQLSASTALPLLGLVSATTVGALVASRRPRNPVGWLLLAFGLLLVVTVATKSYVAYGLVARPGALPAAGAAVPVHAGGYSGAPMVLLALVVLLTPTGSLPSRRWRWLAGALVAVGVAQAIDGVVGSRTLEPPLQSVTNPLGIDPQSPPLVRLLDGAAAVVTIALVPAVLAAAWSLVVRFWRARGVERQQLRWLAYAAALVPVGALVAAAAYLIGGPAAPVVANWAAGTVSWLVPLALGAAVLRYRLYDLDRILSRTLTWGLLTLLLGGGYVLVVLGLGQLLGQDSSLAVAAATLAVAAVFQPARHHIQQAVDRRFNRRRHDAAQTIQAFGVRLREHVDLDTLTAELLAVVEQTMQPTQASVWLRPRPAPLTATGAAMAERGPWP